MKSRFVKIFIFGILAVFMFSGCYGVDSHFSEIKDDLIISAGKSFHRDVQFALGSFSLSIARMFVSFSDEAEDAHEILKRISKVQIAVYKNDSHVVPENRYAIIKSIEEKMCLRGWDCIVKSTHNSEIQTVYIMKSDDSRLSKMFVISLNKKELAMVEVEGNLEEVLAYAIRQKGLGVHQYASN